MKQVEGQVGMFGPDTVSGKMFPELSAATTGRTSAEYSKNSAKSKTQPLQFLDLTGGGGTMLGASWEKITALPGAAWTPNIGECPNAAVESHLWQILEDCPHQRYCLSAKAAQGVLNRAERRGKKLPDVLLEALTEVIRYGVPDTMGL